MHCAFRWPIRDGNGIVISRKQEEPDSLCGYLLIAETTTREARARLAKAQRPWRGPRYLSLSLSPNVTLPRVSEIHMYPANSDAFESAHSRLLAHTLHLREYSAKCSRFPVSFLLFPQWILAQSVRIRPGFQKRRFPGVEIHSIYGFRHFYVSRGWGFAFVGNICFFSEGGGGNFYFTCLFIHWFTRI